MGTLRLKAYRFVSESRGHREDHFFYAESRQQATAHAKRWGKRMGRKMYRPKAK